MLALDLMRSHLRLGVRSDAVAAARSRSRSAGSDGRSPPPALMATRTRLPSRSGTGISYTVPIFAASRRAGASVGVARRLEPPDVRDRGAARRSAFATPSTNRADCSAGGTTPSPSYASSTTHQASLAWPSIARPLRRQLSRARSRSWQRPPSALHSCHPHAVHLEPPSLRSRRSRARERKSCFIGERGGAQPHPRPTRHATGCSVLPHVGRARPRRTGR